METMDITPHHQNQIQRTKKLNIYQILLIYCFSLVVFCYCSLWVAVDAGTVVIRGVNQIMNIIEETKQLKLKEGQTLFKQ